MRTMLSAALAAIVLTVSAPAAAAVIVTDYTFTAPTLGGIVSTQSGTFSVSYNDAAAPGANPFTLTALNLTIGSTLFTTSNVSVIGSALGLNIYGGLNSGGQFGVSGTDDFALLLNANNGQLSAALFDFTLAGVAGSGTTDVAHGLVVARATTGVPEPGTWAMMLLGFSGIGFAMRKQRNPLLQIA